MSAHVADFVETARIGEDPRDLDRDWDRDRDRDWDWTRTAAPAPGSGPAPGPRPALAPGLAPGPASISNISVVVKFVIVVHFFKYCFHCMNTILMPCRNMPRQADMLRIGNLATSINGDQPFQSY